MKEITFCLNYKSNVEEDALFCSVCGEEQESTQKNQLEPSSSFESKQKRSYSITCVIIAAASAAAAAAVIILG